MTAMRWKVRLELPPIRWTPTRSLHLQPSGKLHTLAARALGARPASSLPAQLPASRAHSSPSTASTADGPRLCPLGRQGASRRTCQRAARRLQARPQRCALAAAPPARRLRTACAPPALARALNAQRTRATDSPPAHTVRRRATDSPPAHKCGGAPPIRRPLAQRVRPAHLARAPHRAHLAPSVLPFSRARRS